MGSWKSTSGRGSAPHPFSPHAFSPHTFSTHTFGKPQRPHHLDTRWSIPLQVSLALALALGALFASAGAFATEPPDHAVAPHRLIGVTPAALHPDVERIHPDDTFGWLNYSSSVLRISFDESVADKLICKSPGSFQLREGRLASGEIGLSQFATLCHLAPGDYEYRVDFYPAPSASTRDSRRRDERTPERTLRGRLVVRWGAATDPLR